MHPAFIVPPVSEEVIDLHRAMEKLTPRERHLMGLRFQQDMTLAEAGEALGVSAPRVRQIEQRVFLVLARAMRRTPLPVVAEPEPRETSFADRLREYGKHREAVAKAEAARVAFMAKRQAERAALREEARCQQESSWSSQMEWAEGVRKSLAGKPFKVEWGEGVVVVVWSYGVTIRWNGYPAKDQPPIKVRMGDNLNVGVPLARALVHRGQAQPLSNTDRAAMRWR